MCGIVGYVGKRQAAPILIGGLEKLEYRGYDSAGVAVYDGARLRIVRKKGRVRELKGAASLLGNVGIGHTRWATHGVPSERNAHPHRYGKFTLVHNGIIENAAALKAECTARGEAFSSDTDSEVIAHLIDGAYRGDFAAAVREAAGRLEGSYALAVLCADFPGVVVCARMRSPLVVGRAEDGSYVASDLPAIAEEGMQVFPLDDGEFAVLREEGVTFYNASLQKTEKRPVAFRLDENVPEKRGYRHFMRKEMAEIPAVLEHFNAKIKENSCFQAVCEVLCHAEYIQIVACGTAYHSGLCAAYAFEKLCRVPVSVSVASEYRYKDPIVQKGAVCIAVSQSGETADTLAAAQIAKERGARVVALTNVAYSSLTRIADCVLLTDAGREIAVAATKSFNAQLMALYALARERALRAGNSTAPLTGFPALARSALAAAEGVRSWTPHFLGAKAAFFVGRGADYFAALEGSLKLKEISYLPSEGYAAGELKHGALALIEENTPVVAVLSDEALAEKTMNAVSEVRARGAKVFLVTTLSAYAKRAEATATVLLPACPAAFSPILTVIPLQALAYYVSVARGNDPDKPRNLAKSVTVE